MNEEERHPWEQLPEESNASYMRFCAYLSLGPTRTIEKARASTGVKGRSGHWDRESSKYNWVDRAIAYDIHMLSERGTQVVVNWVQSLVSLSEMAINEAASGKHKPENLGELIGIINVLGEFVSPEVIEAAREFARGDFANPEEE